MTLFLYFFIIFNDVMFITKLQSNFYCVMYVNFYILLRRHRQSHKGFFPIDASLLAHIQYKTIQFQICSLSHYF